jgi:hypothetical protein
LTVKPPLSGGNTDADRHRSEEPQAYNYRINGRRETLTIGRYGPDGLSLARAREKCIDAKRAVSEGQSPAQEKQREKRRSTSATSSNKSIKQIYGFAILHGEKVANPADDVGPSSIATFVPRDRALSPTEILVLQGDGRSSRGVYNKAEYAELRRHMLQEWADMIDAWVAGESHTPTLLPPSMKVITTQALL